MGLHYIFFVLYKYELQKIFFLRGDIMLNIEFENTVEGFEDEGFVKLKEFIKILNISRSTFINLVNEGVIPKPLKLTPKTHLWSKTIVKKTLAYFEEKQGNKKPLGTGTEVDPYKKEVENLQRQLELLQAKQNNFRASKMQ